MVGVDLPSAIFAQCVYHRARIAGVLGLPWISGMPAFDIKLAYEGLWGLHACRDACGTLFAAQQVAVRDGDGRER